MSGVGNTIDTVTATGDARIDGILSTGAWADPVVYYSFATETSIYDNYVSLVDYPTNFTAVSALQQAAIKTILDQSAGTAANDGFSVEGFTNLDIRLDATPDSTTPEQLRYANTFSNALGTAQVGDFPFNSETTELDDNGDVWFGQAFYDYSAPVAGSYAWITHIHETGHALGLTHAHDLFGGFHTKVPVNTDSMEYTVMSYRSYVGASVFGGYTNEDFGYAQTWMMFDIAALQHMYGADFTTNAGNTVYKWDPNSGNTLVNGQIGIEPGDNRIFATIWDGGGIDTYDLSAYITALVLDLRAGAYSVFSSLQLAYLGDGHYARGNMFNALQFEGSLASLIENAIGGSAGDVMTGNQIANTLTGNSGNDTLVGGKGADVLIGGFGGDTETGGGGSDVFKFALTSVSTGVDQDHIRDFTVAVGTGATFVDRIDLAGIDAILATVGDDAFSFVGNLLFSAAGQVRAIQAGLDTIVQVNTSGTTGAEMTIVLDNFTAANLTSFDFIL